MNVYIVSELCDGGALFERIAKESQLNEKIISNLFKQMVASINCCWENDIYHKVLKPDSFRFSSNEGINLKLVDFGLSWIFEEQGSYM